MEKADVAVIGLGAMGSAAAWQLARRGMRVAAFDRFAPPHAMGSTLGESRVTRQATAEGAAYVPLAVRSQALWREIEAETGEEIFTQCGMVMVGPAAGGTAGGLHGIADWLDRTGVLAARFGIEHELMDGAEAAARYPALAVPADYRAYVEPGAGFVRPEAGVRAQLALAARCGAQLHTDTLVTGVRSHGDGVVVTTPAGEFAAAHALVCAGAWVRSYVQTPELRALFEVQRQQLHWYAVDEAHADVAGPNELPVYFWTSGDSGFYGFPSLDAARREIKAATDETDTAVDPDAIDRLAAPGAALDFYDTCLAGRLLAARREPSRSAVCMYTVTPDRGFVIDAHPEIPHVTLVSACCGHGFKHSAAIGEALAQRVVDGGSQIDLAAFALSRFASRT
jgi:sarcosine oxidase